METVENKFKKSDFSSGLDVKWCAGCGDYSALNQIQKTLAEIGRPKEEYAFISGIGCSSRFPYYMGTYGYHTIHGRALAIASGTKIANPDLSVWVVFGDGDGLSIGGNHFIHAARKNLDMVVVMLDNRIYGLTKGQYSPTSRVGQITKTSPYGVLEEPMDPVKMALASGATFVARTTDRNNKLTAKILREAYDHKGFSFVHMYQNCVIFNDGCFSEITGKEKDDTTLLLEDGKPLIFGKDQEKAIIMEDFQPKVVNVSDVDESQIPIHKVNRPTNGPAMLLSALERPDFPAPMGVFYKKEQATTDEAIHQQVQEVTAKQGEGTLESLFSGGDSWTVE